MERIGQILLSNRIKLRDISETREVVRQIGQDRHGLQKLAWKTSPFTVFIAN